jgi:hypothetical protein
MSGFFRFLYELIAGRPEPAMDTPIYRQDVFPDVGALTLLLITFLMVMAYYYVLNYVINTARFSHWYHWLVWLMINATIAFSYAIYYCRLQEVTPDSYVYWFATANAVWSAVFFFVFSMLVKWKSVSAARTPF